MSKTLPGGATTNIVDYQLEKLQELRNIYKSKHCFSEDELHVSRYHLLWSLKDEPWTSRLGSPDVYIIKSLFFF